MKSRRAIGPAAHHYEAEIRLDLWLDAGEDFEEAVIHGAVL
jgi:hypothetical protein